MARWLASLLLGTWDPCSWPGIQLIAPPLQCWFLTHWTSRKVPTFTFQVVQMVQRMRTCPRCHLHTFMSSYCVQFYEHIWVCFFNCLRLSYILSCFICKNLPMFLQYSYHCGLHLVFTLKSSLIWKEHISGLVCFFWLVCLFVLNHICLLEDWFLFTNINRCPSLLFGLSPHDWVLGAV